MFIHTGFVQLDLGEVFHPVGLEFKITLQVGVERDHHNALTSRTDRGDDSKPEALTTPCPSYRIQNAGPASGDRTVLSRGS